jgi:hypothetical protein
LGLTEGSLSLAYTFNFGENMKKTNIILISVLIISILILSGCGKNYVCADGSVKDAKELCAYNKVASIRDRDADQNAENYVKGYLLNTDYRYTYVNSVLNEGDFEVKFIISSKYDPNTYESLILVDGITGNPECVEGCDFMQQVVEVNQTEI